MNIPLSVRQMDVLRFLLHASHHRDHSPTHREIAEAVGLSCAGTLAHHVTRLERAGLVEKAPYGRSLVVTPAGKIAAGGVMTAADRHSERERSAVGKLGKLAAALTAHKVLRIEYESLQLDEFARTERRRVLQKMADARDKLFDVLAEVKA
jgi:DNA-binding MarR family transcriptional regulator